MRHTVAGGPACGHGCPLPISLRGNVAPCLSTRKHTRCHYQHLVILIVIFGVQSIYFWLNTRLFSGSHTHRHTYSGLNDRLRTFIRTRLLTNHTHYITCTHLRMNFYIFIHITHNYNARVSSQSSQLQRPLYKQLSSIHVNSIHSVFIYKQVNIYKQVKIISHLHHSFILRYDMLLDYLLFYYYVIFYYSNILQVYRDVDFIYYELSETIEDLI